MGSALFQHSGGGPAVSGNAAVRALVPRVDVPSVDPPCKGASQNSVCQRLFSRRVLSSKA